VPRGLVRRPGESRRRAAAVGAGPAARGASGNGGAGPPGLLPCACRCADAGLGRGVRGRPPDPADRPGGASRPVTGG